MMIKNANSRLSEEVAPHQKQPLKLSSLSQRMLDFLNANEISVAEIDLKPSSDKLIDEDGFVLLSHKDVRERIKSFKKKRLSPRSVISTRVKKSPSGRVRISDIRLEDCNPFDQLKLQKNVINRKSFSVEKRDKKSFGGISNWELHNDFLISQHFIEKEHKKKLTSLRVSKKRQDRKDFVKSFSKCNRILSSRNKSCKQSKLDMLDVKLQKLSLQGEDLSSTLFLNNVFDLYHLHHYDVSFPSLQGESFTEYTVESLQDILGESSDEEEDCDDIELEEDSKLFASAYDTLMSVIKNVPEVFRNILEALYNFALMILQGSWISSAIFLVHQVNNVCTKLFSSETVRKYVILICAKVKKFCSSVKQYVLDHSFSLRTMIDDFQLFMRSEFYTHFMSMISYIFSLHVCHSMKLSFTQSAFGSLMKKMFETKTIKESPNFLSALLNSCVYIFDKGLECFRQGTFEPIYHDVVTYNQWRSDVQKFFLSYHQWKAQFSMDVLPLLEQAEKLRTIGYQICNRVERTVKSQKKKELQDPLAFFYKMLTSLDTAYMDMKTSLEQSELRRAPFVISFHGASSIGKSTLSSYIHRLNASFEGVDPAGSLWQCTPEDAFCSGLRNSSITALLDDPCSLKEKYQPMGDPLVKYLIPFGNNQPYSPPMAVAEEKGHVFFRASVIIITTNTRDLDVSLYNNNSYATLRRIHAHIHVRVRPEFQDKHGGLDSAKAFAQPHENEFGDFWEFALYEVIPTAGRNEFEPQRHYFSTQPIKTFPNFKEFRKWFCQELVNHKSVQSKIVAEAQSRKLNYQWCPMCTEMLSNCECVRCEMCKKLVLDVSENAHLVDVCRCNLALQGGTDMIVNVSKYLIAKLVMREVKNRVVPILYTSFNIVSGLSLLWSSIFIYTGSSQFASVFVLSCVVLFVVVSLSWISVVSYGHVFVWKKVKSNDITLLASDIREYTYCGIKVVTIIGILTGIAASVALIYSSRKRSRNDNSVTFSCQQEYLSPLEKEKFVEKEYWPVDITPQYKLNMTEASWSFKGRSKFEIVDVLKNNVARVVFENTDGTAKRAHALFVAGQYAIMNNHCVPENAYRVNLFLQPENDSRSSPNYIGKNFSPSREFVRRYPEHDLAVIKFVFVRSRKDIRKLFSKNIFEKNFTDCYLLTRNVDTHQLVVRTERKVGVFKQASHPQLPQLLPDHYFYMGTMEGQITAAGDCGGPVVCITRDGTCILGIHSMGEGNRPVATPVYQDLFKDIELECINQGRPSGIVEQGFELQGDVEGSEVKLSSLSKHAKIRYIEGSAEIYGSLNVPPKKYKSKVEKTPFYDYIAPLTEDKWGIPELNRGKIFENAVIPTFSPAENWDLDLLKESIDYFFESSNSLSDDLSFYVREYSVEECINGRPGVPFMNSVNRKSSLGWPFSGSKEKFIVKLPPDDEYQDPITFTDDVLAEIDRCYNLYKEGTTCCPIYRYVPKDEVTKKKKIADNLTRLFAVGPTCVSLAALRHMYGFVRWFRLNSTAFMHAIGLKSQTEDWNDMVMYLESFKGNYFTGDYSQYDKTQSCALIMLIGYRIAKLHVDLGFREKSLPIISIFSDLAFGIYECRSDLFCPRSQNPSGNFFTTELNSIVGAVCMIYSFKKIYGNTLDFRSHVCAKFYGDDCVVKVSNCAVMFNFEEVSRVLTNIGMKFQSAEKDGRMYTYQSISDITFLKRDFVRDPRFNGNWIGRLSMDSLFKMLLWHTVSDSVPLGQQMASTVSAFLREIYFYGDDIFFEWRDRLVALMQADPSLRPYIAPSTFPTAEMIFKSYYNKGIIEYPISTEIFDCSTFELQCDDIRFVSKKVLDDMIAQLCQKKPQTKKELILLTLQKFCNFFRVKSKKTIKMLYERIRKNLDWYVCLSKFLFESSVEVLMYVLNANKVSLSKKVIRQMYKFIVSVKEKCQVFLNSLLNLCIKDDYLIFRLACPLLFYVHDAIKILWKWTRKESQLVASMETICPVKDDSKWRDLHPLMQILELPLVDLDRRMFFWSRKIHFSLIFHPELGENPLFPKWSLRVMGVLLSGLHYSQILSGGSFIEVIMYTLGFSDYHLALAFHRYMMSLFGYKYVYILCDGALMFFSKYLPLNLTLELSSPPMYVIASVCGDLLDKIENKVADYLVPIFEKRFTRRQIMDIKFAMTVRAGNLLVTCLPYQDLNRVITILSGDVYLVHHMYTFVLGPLMLLSSVVICPLIYPTVRVFGKSVFQAFDKIDVPCDDVKYEVPAFVWKPYLNCLESYVRRDNPEIARRFNILRRKTRWPVCENRLLSTILHIESPKNSVSVITDFLKSLDDLPKMTQEEYDQKLFEHETNIREDESVNLITDGWNEVLSRFVRAMQIAADDERKLRKRQYSC